MIRNMQKADARMVKQICETTLGHKTTVELLKQRIEELTSDSFSYLVVFEDDEDHCVKGFLQAQEYNLLYGEKGWNIIALAVTSNAQKQGIGSQLLSSLETYAKGKKDTFVRLNCRIERADAHAFYSHFGYECDKTQKRFIKYIDIE